MSVYDKYCRVYDEIAGETFYCDVDDLLDVMIERHKELLEQDESGELRGVIEAFADERGGYENEAYLSCWIETSPYPFDGD